VQDSPDNRANARKELEDLIELQTATLRRLEEHFAPGTIEEIEERRIDRLRALAIRTASIVVFSVSGILGAWEFGVYIKESWDIRSAAANYAEVGVRLYYEENNIAVAKEFLEKALELSPNDAGFLYLDAYIDGMAEIRRLLNLDRPYNSEELDAAYRALAKSILLEQQDPGGAEAHILRGQIYAALKERDRAIKALKTAIGIDPTNDFAVMRLGVVEYGDGKVEEAIGLFDRALGINPKSKWAMLWKGIVFSDQKKLTEAREQLSAALAIDPRFDLALYNLGWIELKEKIKNYSGAEGYFRRALAVNPSYKEALYGLGMVYGYQNQYEIALGYLSQAIDLDPDFLTAWKWRGIVNYELKNFDEAVEDFSAGLALDPANADLFVRRARVSILTGEFDSGLKDLLIAKKFDAKNPRIYLYLAEVYEQLERFDIAQETLSEALKIRPNYAEAHALAASIYLDQGQKDLAETAYRSAIDSTQYKQERFALPLARLMLERGDHQAASILLEPLAEKADSTAVWLELFNAAIGRQDFARAREALAAFTRLDPGSNAIEKMRSQIGD